MLIKTVLSDTQLAALHTATASDENFARNIYLYATHEAHPRNLSYYVEVRGSQRRDDGLYNVTIEVAEKLQKATSSPEEKVPLEKLLRILRAIEVFTG